MKVVSFCQYSSAGKDCYVITCRISGVIDILPWISLTDLKSLFFFYHEETIKLTISHLYEEPMFFLLSLYISL